MIASRLDRVGRCANTSPKETQQRTQKTWEDQVDVRAATPSIFARAREKQRDKKHTTSCRVWPGDRTRRGCNSQSLTACCRIEFARPATDVSLPRRAPALAGLARPRSPPFHVGRLPIFAPSPFRFPGPPAAWRAWAADLAPYSGPSKTPPPFSGSRLGRGRSRIPAAAGLSTFLTCGVAAR